MAEFKRKGMMFIVSAPSGGGKGTVIKKVMQQISEIQLSISATTRAIRNGDVEGQTYYFIDDNKFDEMIKNNEFLEFVNSDFGPRYGIPKGPVDELLAKGIDVIFDLDFVGVQRLRQIAKDKVIAINLLPPSIKELESRLINRQSDSTEAIERRMSMAPKRIKEAVYYDYTIFNDDLEKTVESVKSIILSNRVKKENITNLDETISQILEDK